MLIEIRVDGCWLEREFVLLMSEAGYDMGL